VRAACPINNLKFKEQEVATQFYLNKIYNKEAYKDNFHEVERCLTEIDLAL
jgi:hypothetical protein